MLDRVRTRVDSESALAMWLGEVTPQDADSVRALFGEVFGADPGAAWFDWKYGVGGGEAVGVWDTDGHELAHFGGFGRRLWVPGDRGVLRGVVGGVVGGSTAVGTADRAGGGAEGGVRAVQIGDVMVAPRARVVA